MALEFRNGPNRREKERSDEMNDNENTEMTQTSDQKDLPRLQIFYDPRLQLGVEYGLLTASVYCGTGEIL